MLTGALSGAGLLGAGFATSSGSSIFAEEGRHDPVRSVTVAFTSVGNRSGSGDRAGIDAEAAARLPRHSRVMPELEGTDPASRQEAFLDRCAPWLNRLPHAHRDLATSALLDLWVLTDSLPATVASWNGPWRYIWPRDAAFAAVALGRVGMTDIARDHLLHLQNLQTTDGSFAARFTPDTGQVPDDRAPQFDSIGLLMWAVAEVSEAMSRQSGERSAAEFLSEMSPMLRRSSARLLSATEHGRTLPPPSPDYWEVSESQVSLGIVGPTLLGLHALATLSETGKGLFAHIDGGGDAVGDAARAFESTFSRTFSANGLQRYRTHGGPDSAVAYVPAAGYIPAAGAGFGLSSADLDRVWDQLSQPAGGIKPGHGWIFDHSSWTPSTSLMGLAYARLGEMRKAEGILEWLAAHRTVAGSLPEKVSAGGDGLSVAPLSWTASNVIICLDELAA